MQKNIFKTTTIMIIAMFLLSACGQDDTNTPPAPDTKDSITAQAAPSSQNPLDSSTDATPAKKTGGNHQSNGATGSETDATKGNFTGQPQAGTDHNAMNSLDYFGTYLAESPNNSHQKNNHQNNSHRTNSQQDSITRLSLHKDGSCLLVMQDGKTLHDTFTWDPSGSVIYIGSNQRSALSFFVGEGYLLLGATSPKGDGPRFTQQSGESPDE